MKLKITPGNLMERVAILFNLVPAPIMDTHIAFIEARAIMTAAELGIFEALGKEHKTSEQISDKTNTHPATTRILLDCLTGIGYLKWRNNSYALRPKYYKWLLQEYPSNLIGKLRFQLIEWNWMTHLEDHIRTGNPLELHSAIKDAEWTKYQDGMRDIAVNSAKELPGKIKLPDRATKMLDIGGSHGLYSIELCKKYSGLSSTILELPGAIQRASAIAAEQGSTERVQYRQGNALTDDLGEQQYDLVMINNLVHHFTIVQNISLAKKVARALKPGGMYAIGEFISGKDPGKTDAVSSCLGLYFSLTSESGIWPVEEVRSWQQQAGLIPQKPIVLLSVPDWRMMTAIK